MMNKRADWMVMMVLVAMSTTAVAFPDPLVGEWSDTAAQCQSVRLAFTRDQRHQALIYQNAQWLEARGAPYVRDGRWITVMNGDLATRLHIESLDAERLTLRNDNRQQTEALGADRLDLIRCPERSQT